MYAQLKERLSPDGKTHLFLDEVQEIKGWEKVVNSLASDFDVDLYVTGSNSRMMSSEISTYLTGRHVSFRIFTLSFGEYLMFKSQYTEVGEPKAELVEKILRFIATVNLYTFEYLLINWKYAMLKNIIDVRLEFIPRGQYWIWNTIYQIGY